MDVNLKSCFTHIINLKKLKWSKRNCSRLL